MVRKTLLNDYYPVLPDPRYGDVLVLARRMEASSTLKASLRTMLFIRKNSANFRDPYILMTIQDMVDNFEAQIPEGQSLSLQYYRNKYY